MRKISLVISAVLMLFGALQVASALPVQACDLNAHCYGIGQTPNSTNLNGIESTISPTCLSAPSGNFLTDEMWLNDDTQSHWVEAGYLVEGSGLNVGGIMSAGTYGFWADLRPGYDFAAHVLQTSPSLAYTNVSILGVGNNTYQTAFGSHVGDSVANTMNADNIQVGSETTSSASHGYSFAKSAMWEDDAQALHSGVWQGQALTPNAPQQFSWITRPTSYNAGTAC